MKNLSYRTSPKEKAPMPFSRQEAFFIQFPAQPLTTAVYRWAVFLFGAQFLNYRLSKMLVPLNSI
jgi:hypothetical protein